MEKSTAEQRRQAFNNARVATQRADDALRRGDAEEALRQIAAGFADRDLLTWEFRFILGLRQAEIRRFGSDHQGAFDDLEVLLAEIAGTEDPSYLGYRAHALELRAVVLVEWGLLDQARRSLDDCSTVFENIDSTVARLAAERLANLAITTRSEALDLALADLDRQLKVLSFSLPAARVVQHFATSNLLLAREDFAGVLEYCTTALADATLYAQFPAERCQLELQRAKASLEIARIRGGEYATVRSDLEAIQADPGLSPSDRNRATVMHEETDLLTEKSDHWSERFAEWVRVDVNADRVSNPLDVERAAMFAKWIVDRGGSPAAILGAQQRLESVLTQFITRWSHTQPRTGGHGVLCFGRIRALLSESFRVSEALGESAEASMSSWLAASALDSLSRALGATAPSITDIRQALLSGSVPRGILVYLPAPYRTDLVAIDQAHVRHFSLARSDEVLAKSRALGSLLSEYPSGSPAERSARRAAIDRARSELGELLLPREVLDHIAPWRGITVVGSELIDQVSFEILPYGAQPWLGAAVALDHLPSLASGVALARTAGAAREPTLAFFAAPTLPEAMPTPRLGEQDESAFATIQLAAKSMDAIAERYPAGGVVRHGANATLANLSRPECTGASVLQILTHGSNDFTAVRPARLLFADGEGGISWLDADGIESIFAPPRTAPVVVFLAACGSGSGPTRRGDATAADLTGAFLSRGSRAVVSATRDLDLRVAVQASVVFHAALLAGSSAAEALRQARTRLLEDEALSDPYHLAHLRVVGLGQQDLLRVHALPATAEMDWVRNSVVLGFLALVVILLGVRMKRQRSSP